VLCTKRHPELHSTSMSTMSSRGGKTCLVSRQTAKQNRLALRHSIKIAVANSARLSAGHTAANKQAAADAAVKHAATTGAAAGTDDFLMR
jgi:hypothetical protein